MFLKCLTANRPTGGFGKQSGGSRNDGMGRCHASLTSPGNIITAKLKSEDRTGNSKEEKGTSGSYSGAKVSQRLIDLMLRLQMLQMLNKSTRRAPTPSHGHVQGTEMLFW